MASAPLTRTNTPTLALIHLKYIANDYKMCIFFISIFFVNITFHANTYDKGSSSKYYFIKTTCPSEGGMFYKAVNSHYVQAGKKTHSFW